MIQMNSHHLIPLSPISYLDFLFSLYITFGSQNKCLNVPSATYIKTWIISNSMFSYSGPISLCDH